MKCSVIFTKVHKSSTLAFNWLVTILATVSVVAIDYIPMLKDELTPKVYFVLIVTVSVVNTLLRAKTTKALEDK